MVDMEVYEKADVEVDKEVDKVLDNKVDKETDNKIDEMELEESMVGEVDNGSLCDKDCSGNPRC